MLPRYVDQATRHAGESWPHVLAQALSGGQPLERLELPRVRETAGQRAVWVASLAALYAVAAWVLR